MPSSNMLSEFTETCHTLFFPSFSHPFLMEKYLSNLLIHVVMKGKQQHLKNGTQGFAFHPESLLWTAE